MVAKNTKIELSRKIFFVYLVPAHRPVRRSCNGGGSAPARRCEKIFVSFVVSLSDRHFNGTAQLTIGNYYDD